MTNFYLKAEPDFHGKLRVLEFFTLQVGKKVLPGGVVAFEIDREGLVDQDIIASNPKDYASFKALVDANQEKLYGEAIASGAKVYPAAFLAAPVEVPVVEPKVKKAKAKELEDEI